MQATRKKSVKRSKVSGQATAELLAALVGLTVLFTGVLQVAILGDAATANMMEARSDAMLAAENALVRENESVADWESGDDGLDYSFDDEVQNGNVAQINAMIIELNGGEASLPNTVVHDWMTAELGAGTGYAANLYKGESDRQVPLESALKKLLFLTVDELELSDQAYLPGLRIDAVESE